MFFHFFLHARRFWALTHLAYWPSATSCWIRCGMSSLDMAQAATRLVAPSLRTWSSPWCGHQPSRSCQPRGAQLPCGSGPQSRSGQSCPCGWGKNCLKRPRAIEQAFRSRMTSILTKFQLKSPFTSAGWSCKQWQWNKGQVSDRVSHVDNQLGHKLTTPGLCTSKSHLTWSPPLIS